MRMGIKYNNKKRNCSYASLRTKKCRILEKIALCGLFLGLFSLDLGFRFPSSSFLQFSSLVDDDVTSYHAQKPHKPSSVKVTPDEEECNIFEGEWVEDPSPPTYTVKTCRWVRSYKNCVYNGRPDDEYIHWRWKPKQCELGKLNPGRFLEKMINKTFSFIGDSVVRNQMESLVCILAQVEQPTEVFHDREYRNRKFYFPSHNFTLSVIWSPVLIRADSKPPATVKSHLDQLDPLWTQQLEKLDYIVIGGGKWFLGPVVYYQENQTIGCHICPVQNLTEIGFNYAYRKSLQMTLDFISKTNPKAITFFRTITPTHFEYGGWSSGGYCNRTEPFKGGQIALDDIDAVMRNIEAEEVEKAAIDGAARGWVLKLIDITLLSLLRPDGHPGLYRKFHPHDEMKYPSDCLHWCLPGPIDTWNYLMMETLSRFFLNFTD